MKTTRHYARKGALAYVHFRNVRGQVPNYAETFVDDGDVDMTEIVRILRDEGFDGVLVPDHVPELDLRRAVACGPRLYGRLHEGPDRARRRARPVLVGGAARGERPKMRRRLVQDQGHIEALEQRAQEETMKSLRLASYLAMSVLSSVASIHDRREPATSSGGPRTGARIGRGRWPRNSWRPIPASTSRWR